MIYVNSDGKGKNNEYQNNDGYKLANYASGKDEIKNDISNLANQKPTLILAI